MSARLPDLRSSEWLWVPTGKCFEMTATSCVFEVLRLPDNMRGVAKLVQEGRRGLLESITKQWRAMNLSDTPNAARLMDSGETTYHGKRAFFVVSELVDRMGTWCSGSDVKEAARVGLGILTGLEALHAKGFSHNDVCPWSIGISTDDLPVLCTFKNAKKMGKVFFSQRPLFYAYRTTYESKPYHDVQSLLYTLIYMLDGKLPWAEDEDYAYDTEHRMAKRMAIMENLQSETGVTRGLAQASLEVVDAENPYEVARRALHELER